MPVKENNKNAVVLKMEKKVQYRSENRASLMPNPMLHSVGGLIYPAA